MIKLAFDVQAVSMSHTEIVMTGWSIVREGTVLADVLIWHAKLRVLFALHLHRCLTPCRILIL